jgi:hypothetical protein
MANLCSNADFHGCPASFYLKCPGYKKGLNCWEIERKPCCPNTDSMQCTDCKVSFRRGGKV